MVSAHRGGAMEGFPENCIATFEHTIRDSFAILEIDPRYTKGGDIVLMHDASLERTTTGTGLVNEHTLEELLALRLKDLRGRETPYRLSTLEEAIAWSQGKTILVIDQKDVPAIARAKRITDLHAEAWAILIVYSFADARAVYRMNPDIMMEVMIPTFEKARQFEELGVPWRNVIAFIGHDPPYNPKLCKHIHEAGACVMIGTSRNLDKRVLSREVKDFALIEQDYMSLVQNGADLIETDIPTMLGPLLRSNAAIPSDKTPYFCHP